MDTEKTPDKNQDIDEALKPLSFRELLTTTLWAALGVQKSENRKRDFSRGHWLHFIYMGIGFATFFAASLILLVHFILM